MHIGVFGLSGSGKTALTDVVTSHYPNFLAISASRLIAKFGGVVDYKSLDHNNIKSNQHVLVQAYELYRRNHPLTLIELHCLIESEVGVDLVDVEILRALNLDVAFFIEVPAEEILRRRISDANNKVRRVTSISEIERLQNLSIEIFRKAFPTQFAILNPKNAIETVDSYIRNHQ